MTDQKDVSDHVVGELSAILSTLLCHIEDIDRRIPISGDPEHLCGVKTGLQKAMFVIGLHMSRYLEDQEDAEVTE